MNDNYLVSIFMPVYNGEKYLDETLRSILNQTYSNLEILLVDDSSTDNSYGILKKIESKDSRIKVFKKENGGMVAKSFNFILPHLKGDFFYYSSQDDLFSRDLIEKMVNKQKETNADTVLPDMEFYFENKKENKKIIGLHLDRNVVLSGKEALIESLNWNIHGFALFKTSLLDNEFFPEDAFDSDEFVTRKMFLKSNKVVFCEGTFFYRQDNSEAITKIFSKKKFYVLSTFEKLYNLLKENEIDEEYIYETQFNFLRVYMRLASIYSFYNFKTETDENEIKLYLSSFKKKIFNTDFYLENFKFALKNRKVKFLLFLIIYKIPLFFMVAKSIYSWKNKKQFVNV
uniref:glycosyltransferase family 2 protein n=1 Tax=Flavobacterium sp. TaxID=239 RepID=UPI0040498A1A